MIQFHFDQIKIPPLTLIKQKRGDEIFNITDINNLVLSLLPRRQYNILRNIIELDDISSVQIEGHLLTNVAKAICDNSAIYLFIQLIRLSKDNSIFSPFGILSDEVAMKYNHFLAALAVLEEFNLIKIYPSSIPEIKINRNWQLQKI